MSNLGSQTRSDAAITPFRCLTDAALSRIRQIYESVPATRDALAALFAVDAAQTEPNEAWVGFLVETACSQLVWDERPTGTLTAEAAGWVLERFDAAPTIATLAVLVRLIEEAAHLPAGFDRDVRKRAALFGGSAKQDVRRGPVPYLRLVA